MTTSQEIREALDEHKVPDFEDYARNIITRHAPEWLSYLLSELDAKTAESELWQKQNKLLVKNNVTYKEQIETIKQENERLNALCDIRNDGMTVFEDHIQTLKQKLKQVEGLRPEVLWFAQQMEQTLRKNDHKGGWKVCDIDYLMERLNDEAKELYYATEAPSDTYVQNIINEATDVANFAMMIADNSRLLIRGEVGKEQTT